MYHCKQWEIENKNAIISKTAGRRFDIDSNWKLDGNSKTCMGEF